MKTDELRKKLGGTWDPSVFQGQRSMDDLARLAGFDPGTFYQELEMNSRYVDTHPDTTWSNATVSLHSHSFFELLCCRNTCGVEYLVGTQRYRLQKGDIVFVSPGVSHRPILPEPTVEPYQRDVLWFSEEFAQLITQCVPQTPSISGPVTNLVRTAGTKWEFLADLFHRGVQEAIQRKEGWELALMGNTMLILTYLRRALWEQSADTLRAETPDLLDGVMAYIEAHLAEKISLGDTARHFYVSQSTVSHLFSQKMGVSFYRCVTQRRLIAAKERIWQGMPMDEVSRQVGFRDYSSFYRAFRQEYGISPQQYRRLQNESEG